MKTFSPLSLIVGAVMALTLMVLGIGSPASVLAEEKLPPGFIAMSEEQMNWADARVFCQEKGGKLPRFNNSDSSPFVEVKDGERSVDGFGSHGVPWPSALPLGNYWTGTEVTNAPGNSWDVGIYENKVYITGDLQSSNRRVVCVP